MAKKKILIVDDEEDMRILLKAKFRLEGFDCTCVSNGYDGLKFAKAEHPALIILDMSMPGMDGLQVYKSLMADGDTNDIPIIAYTAQTSDAILAKDGLEGVDILSKGTEALDIVHFMLKPCEHEEFISAVKKLLNDHEQVSIEQKKY